MHIARWQQCIGPGTTWRSKEQVNHGGSNYLLLKAFTWKSILSASTLDFQELLVNT